MDNESESEAEMDPTTAFTEGAENAIKKLEIAERSDPITANYMMCQAVQQINEIYKYEKVINPNLITQFESDLSDAISALPSFAHFWNNSNFNPRVTLKEFIIYFLSTLTYRCRTLSATTWLSQDLLSLFYNELAEDSDQRDSILLIFANITVTIRCYDDEATKQLLTERYFVGVIYEDFQRANKLKNGHFTGNEVSFTLYILAWSSDADNEYLRTMIMDKELNAIDMVLSELSCALKNEAVEYESISFIPAVWNRMCFINILMDNTEFQQLLLEKDIMEYFAAALKFEEKQKRDTLCLKRQCCEALSKLVMDQSVERHNLFLKYRFDEFDLWTSLEEARGDEQCDAFVRVISERMRCHYFDVIRENQLDALPLDCYSAIITFIW